VAKLQTVCPGDSPGLGQQALRGITYAPFLVAKYLAFTLLLGLSCLAFVSFAPGLVGVCKKPG
jgi:hypothetical protein